MSRRRKRVKQSSRKGKRAGVSRKDRSISSGTGKGAVRERTKVVLTGRKLWAFRLISVVVFPLIAVVLLEIGLRAGGYGFEARVVVPGEVEGVRCLVSNDSFGRLFFPAQLSREFDPFALAVDKADDHCRIVVLGASAVQGVPDGAYSFSRMLKVLMGEAYPGVEFEVFNAGMTAINSHSVLQIARDMRGSKADVFVVYLGNNEVVGPYGAGTVFSPLKGNLSLIRAGIGLRRYRLGQLMSALGGRGKDEKFDRWGGMEMYVEQQVSAEDSRLETVYAHFEKNLEDICSVARGTGAKVLLSTVGSNLRDCAPFVSVHGEGLSAEEQEKWEAIYEEGVALEEAGDIEGAVEKYLSCEAIDSIYAGLHFRLGRMHEKAGTYDEALESYRKARELDALRFRADDRINSIIREVAEEGKGKGVYFVDGAAVFAERSEHDIPGGKLFYEHVHMTFEGNAVIAEALLRSIEDALPGWVQSKRVEVGTMESGELADRLAFTEIDRLISKEQMLDVYLKHPPFTNQLYHAEEIVVLEEERAGLRKGVTKDVVDRAAAVYEKAIERCPEDWWLRWKYAELLADRLGDTDGAIEQCRRVLELVPQYRKGHALLGGLLQQAGILLRRVSII